MTEVEPKRIHTLVRELHSLIKNAQEQWGISLTGQRNVNDKFKSFPSIANAVHPLGPINIVGLTTEFSQKIALIRSTISNFRNTTVHDMSQFNLNTDFKALLKQYRFYLKEESDHFNAVSEVRENIKICKELALDICQNSQDTFKFVIQQTSIFGKQLGLKAWEAQPDHGSTFTLTIYGSIIVIDIKFDETAHKIVQVTITIPEEDDRIDNLLTLQLSNFRYFKMFKKNFQALATLDMLSKTYVIACFHCIKCISNDIKSIYKKEFSAFAGDIQKILTDGHGIPLFHVERVGPSIAYWAPKWLKTDWNTVKDVIAKGDSCDSLSSFHQLWIMMEESRIRNDFLPMERNGYLIEENDNELELLQSYNFMPPDLTHPSLPLKYLQPSKDGPHTSADLQFVLWLCPPVYVTDTVAEDLAEFFGTRIETNDPNSLSLEKLLISDIVPPANVARGSAVDINWAKKFEDSQYTQIYFLDTKGTNAKKIERIPFIHPYQIFGFIKTLRQQLVYNALFQSFFNSSTYCPRQSSFATTLEEVNSNSTKVQIKVQTTNPPHSLSISFQIPDVMTNILLQINILPDSQLFVKVISQNQIWEDNIDNILTQKLQLSQDVPMLIKWILEESLVDFKVVKDDDLMET